jgi:hypothetical protein
LTFHQDEARTVSRTDSSNCSADQNLISRIVQFIPLQLHQFPASVNENPKLVSAGILELSEWPDSLINEALFDWNFEPDQHEFFNYFEEISD